MDGGVAIRNLPQKQQLRRPCKPFAAPHRSKPELGWQSLSPSVFDLQVDKLKSPLEMPVADKQAKDVFNALLLFKPLYLVEAAV